MIAKLALLVGALTCVSAAPSDTLPVAKVSHATMNDGLPPERFRGNNAAIVIFADRAGIDQMCGVAAPGYRIVACKFDLQNGAPVIVMPNPCPLGSTENYARVMCHELGHVNGWTGEHED